MRVHQRVFIVVLFPKWWLGSACPRLHAVSTVSTVEGKAAPAAGAWPPCVEYLRRFSVSAFTPRPPPPSLRPPPCGGGGGTKQIESKKQTRLRLTDHWGRRPGEHAATPHKRRSVPSCMRLPTPPGRRQSSSPTHRQARSCRSAAHLSTAPPPSDGQCRWLWRRHVTRGIGGGRRMAIREKRRTARAHAHDPLPTHRLLHASTPPPPLLPLALFFSLDGR
jgi:hypothetical protein